MNMKAKFKSILSRLPVLRTLFFKYYLYRNCDEKTLRVEIQRKGHCVDLCFIDNLNFG
jgi:hypothetical protein